MARKKFIKKEGTFNLFINPVFTVQVENGPKLKVKGMLAITQIDNQWVIEDKEISEIMEITFMDITNTEWDDIKKHIDHFNILGPNLWTVVENEFDKIIQYPNIPNLIYDYTGIKI